MSLDRTAGPLSKALERSRPVCTTFALGDRLGQDPLLLGLTVRVPVPKTHAGQRHCRIGAPALILHQPGS